MEHNLRVIIKKLYGEYSIGVVDMKNEPGFQNADYVAQCYGGFNKWNTVADKDTIYIAICKFEHPWELDDFISGKTKELQEEEYHKYIKVRDSLTNCRIKYPDVERHWNEEKNEYVTEMFKWEE